MRKIKTIPSVQSVIIWYDNITQGRMDSGDLVIDGDT